MSTITNRTNESSLRTSLNDIIKLSSELKTSEGPSIWRAAQDMLVALDYDDNILADSALNSLGAVLQEMLQKFADEQVGVSNKIRDIFVKIRSAIRGKCIDDDIDDFARNLIGRVDHVLRKWTDAQISAKHLASIGFPILRLTELQFEIDALQDLKEKFVANWPWSKSSEPAYDRDIAERARAEFQRGECDSVDDLLNKWQVSN